MRYPLARSGYIRCQRIVRSCYRHFTRQSSKTRNNQGVSYQPSLKKNLTIGWELSVIENRLNPVAYYENITPGNNLEATKMRKFPLQLLCFLLAVVCLTAESMQQRVSAQSETCRKYGTSVAFAESPGAASRQASEEEKLVFVLHVSGDFETSAYT